MATAKAAVAVQQPGNGEMAFSQETPDFAKTSSNRGSENVGAADIVLPRLEIVQSESPIKDANEEAREGMLFNSASSDLLGTSVHIIPVYYRMEFLIWKDQNQGGGFFGAYDSREAAEQRLQEVISDGEDPADLEIVDTPVHYCLRVKQVDGKLATEQIVISMAKSKAKVSRKWNATIQIAGGDRFARVYKVSTFKDKNKQGKTFQNFVVQPAGFPPKELFEIAEKTYDTFSKGYVKADHTGNAEGSTERSKDMRDDI